MEPLKKSKPMNKKYRSNPLAALHETIEGLRDANVIGKQTMREFDQACLAPAVALAPEEIKAIRLRERVSQPVFAPVP